MFVCCECCVLSGKPEAATAVVELLMMGMRMPETCVFKQVINLRSCCISLVNSVENNSVNDFVKVYFLHCFVQHVSALDMSHLQVDYFFLVG